MCGICYRKTLTGSSNPNWRGGITPIHKKLRASEEYKAWRIAVFERDKYTCQICGQVGWTLHAHHISPFCADMAGRLDVANGQTLCEPCHHKTDSFLAKAKKVAIPLPTLKDRFRFRSRKNFLAYMKRQMRSWLWTAGYCRCACGYWFKSRNTNGRCSDCARKDRIRRLSAPGRLVVPSSRSRRHLTYGEIYMEQTMKSWLSAVNFHRCRCGLWFETKTTRRRCISCNAKHRHDSYVRNHIPKRDPNAPPRLCSVAGCGSKYESSGYCQKHLSRFKRHGDPSVVKKGGYAPLPKRPCRMCSDNAICKGLCKKHYYLLIDRFKKVRRRQ